jgi:hypothetical protein
VSIISEAVVDSTSESTVSSTTGHSATAVANQYLRSSDVTKQKTVVTNFGLHEVVSGVHEHVFNSKTTCFVILFLMWRQTTSHNTSLYTSHLLFRVCWSL